MYTKRYLRTRVYIFSGVVSLYTMGQLCVRNTHETREITYTRRFAEKRDFLNTRVYSWYTV